MDRRRFLSLLATGAPAAVVAGKLDLVERVRSYFFAPRGGWKLFPVARLSLPQRIALGRSSGVVLYGGGRGGGKMSYIVANAQSLRVGDEIQLMRSSGLFEPSVRIVKINGNVITFADWRTLA